MSAPGQWPIGPEEGRGWNVVRVGANLQLAAIARLLDLRADDLSVADFVRQSTMDGTDLSRMWAACEPGGIEPGRVLHRAGGDQPGTNGGALAVVGRSDRRGPRRRACPAGGSGRGGVSMAGS